MFREQPSIQMKTPLRQIEQNKRKVHNLSKLIGEQADTFPSTLPFSLDVGSSSSSNNLAFSILLRTVVLGLHWGFSLRRCLSYDAIIGAERLSNPLKMVVAPMREIKQLSSYLRTRHLSPTVAILVTCISLCGCTNSYISSPLSAGLKTSSSQVRSIMAGLNPAIL